MVVGAPSGGGRRQGAGFCCSVSLAVVRQCVAAAAPLEEGLTKRRRMRRLSLLMLHSRPPLIPCGSPDLTAAFPSTESRSSAALSPHPPGCWRPAAPGCHGGLSTPAWRAPSAPAGTATGVVTTSAIARSTAAGAKGGTSGRVDEIQPGGERTLRWLRCLTALRPFRIAWLMPRPPPAMTVKMTAFRHSVCAGRAFVSAAGRTDERRTAGTSRERGGYGRGGSPRLGLEEPQGDVRPSGDRDAAVVLRLGQHRHPINRRRGGLLRGRGRAGAE